MALNLATFELRGTLSPSIGNLTFLKDLNLANNSFFGSIPPEISKLYHLQHLLLSNNSFSGEIPRNFTFLTELIVIGLDRNNLRGTIPAEIGSLSNVNELHLSFNNLNGTIPSTLGNLSALRVLSLSDNNLKGIIPQEFGKLSSLQVLQLSDNQLTGILPLLLQNISSIQSILLGSNMLTGPLHWNFGLQLPNLQIFSIAQNQFLGPIPPSITNASALMLLDFSFNSFNGSVPKDLGNLGSLQHLDFSYNSLSTIETLGLNFMTSLTNCTNLNVLHLHFNMLGGVLPSSIANLSTKLTSLRLDGNHIYGEIPGGLGNLKNLGRLTLSQNNLTGLIPESFGVLSSLQVLILSSNNFFGGIPSSIGNLTLLSRLEMQHNELTGGIPSSLSNCRTLLLLDLSNNHLTDVIPKQIFGLSSMTDLRLAHNLLSGHLPYEVGRMVYLNNFDFSDNILIGELPSSLGSCISLQMFSAQGNLLSGSIPASVGQLLGIQYLDLSRNNLAGRIPAVLSSLNFLQFLDLSFNMLEGEVPKKGLFANITAFSIKGNEKLCGGIKPLHLPECPKQTSRKGKVKFSIVILLPSVGVIIVWLAYYCALYYWPRRARSLSIRVPMDSPLGDHYPKISYTELLQATDGFSQSNLIAKGRYSWVYRGILRDTDQSIAVKVIKLDQSGARKSFVAECEALRNIRHRNLVKIITSCSGTDFNGNEFKALVYGFMSNGNLDSWLHPPAAGSQHLKSLNLIQRINIAIDIASALVYLHHNCEIPVIHRDIKPSNMLLDDEFCAHVGDFGSARSLLLPIDKTTRGGVHSSAIGIVGTVGYIALECAIGGVVSTLVDVYSYGILLLEMFTGKRPTDSMFKDNFSLHYHVKMAIPDQVMSIADPRLLAEWDNNSCNVAGTPRRLNIYEIEKCLASVFRVGVICSAHLPKERMEIADALAILQTIRDALS